MTKKEGIIIILTTLITISDFFISSYNQKLDQAFHEAVFIYNSKLIEVQSDLNKIQNHQNNVNLQLSNLLICLHEKSINDCKLIQELLNIEENNKRQSFDRLRSQSEELNAAQIKYLSVHENQQSKDWRIQLSNKIIRLFPLLIIFTLLFPRSVLKGSQPWWRK